MKKNFFLSTAIDYPSDRPHLGHAYERILADVIARHKRLEGFNLHFSVGLDEHGSKIQRIAEAEGKKPQIYVDEMAKHYLNLSKVLNISYDDFIRTTEERHNRSVKALFDKIYKKGDIYKGHYRGLYCVDCETYYLPKDLKNGKCPIHQKPLEIVEEETYFFEMGKYQKQLLTHIEENKNFIVPESKRKEVLNRLKEPLQDLSISRKKVEWGIPLPIDEKSTLFVWVDALINYLTTIGYPAREFTEFWPADIHVIGKDIIWHHTVIWGSLLLSAGLSLPKTIFVHGFIFVDGQKMSKSLGNVIDPLELVEQYGVDPVRYYLLREISPTEDGDYSRQKFEGRYNADLANGLGNLVSRVLTLAEKISRDISRDISGDFRQQTTDSRQQNKLNGDITKSWKTYREAIENYQFNEALIAIWKLTSASDELISRERPWEDKQESLFTVYCLLLSLSNIAWMLKPFLPETSDKIFGQLGVDPGSEIPWEKQGFRIKKGEPLFPRI